MDNVIFSDFGIEIINNNQKYYLIFDDGEIVYHRARYEIEECDIKKITQSEADAYQFIINLQNKTGINNHANDDKIFIKLPECLLAKIGSEFKMDVHIIDIKLINGKIIKKLIVRNGKYITGFENDEFKLHNKEFKSEDIYKIRPSYSLRSLFGIF